MPRYTLAALGFSFAIQAAFLLTGAQTAAQAKDGSPSIPQGSHTQAQEIPVAVFDPTRQSPSEILWRPYPAPPPPGFHWQHTGSLATKRDRSTGQPLSGQPAGSWILVRDGYSMPKVR